MTGTKTVVKSAQVKASAPTKAQQAETSAALTKAQERSLETLVAAVKAGVVSFQQADSQADSLRVAADTAKVLVCRAVGKLADHPATKATRGIKSGEPALTKIAALTGFAPSTLEPLFKAAMIIRGKGWHKRTSAPTDEERALVRGHVQSENDARYARATKAPTKGKGKGTTKAPSKGTKVTFDSLVGEIAALTKGVESFTKDNGFTNAQADQLATALDAIHDMIEKATAK